MIDKTDDKNENLVVSERKSVWSEPTLTRLDVSMTQTVFNTFPDGDTQS